MKRVLFMIPTLGGGGAEKVLVTLLNSLNQNKYDITLFSLFDEGTNKKLLDKKIRYKSFFRKQFRGNIHILKMFSPKTLYKYIIKEEYDIAISYLEGPTTRIIGGCPFPNTKLLNWIHTDLDEEKKLLKSYRNKKEMINIYNKFEETIFVSTSNKNTFVKKFPEIKTRMNVKYNSVDNELIRKLSQKKIKGNNFEKNKINFISVGRYTKVKGYVRLINIINKLVQEGYDNIHLYLVGTGELESLYQKLIKKYTLENYITLLGYKDNPYKYVKRADFFVCSSYREGFSTAVTESITVGTPVITTLCSGMIELLGSNDEYGIVTENSEESLFIGVKFILDNPNLIQLYRTQTLKRSKKFELRKTIKEIENMFDSY